MNLHAWLNYPLRAPEDIDGLREAVKREFPEEHHFLMELPVILESEHYIFVHGGVPGEDSLNRRRIWKTGPA